MVDGVRFGQQESAIGGEMAPPVEPEKARVGLRQVASTSHVTTAVPARSCLLQIRSEVS
jgi:hypothetical protein